MTNNKRFRVLRDATILAVVLLVVTVIWVMADTPPNTISYQGYLTDASGNAITDTPDMQVVLYTVDTGGTGVYTETHSSVTVSDGQFNLLLGTGTTSDTWDTDVDFSQALWMEITIDPSGTPETLSPRIPLSSVPYARHAFETDQVGAVTSNNWCQGDGSAVQCNTGSTVNGTEFSYLNGVTGTIQTQLNSKLSTESDPQVDTLTANQWCATNAGGTAIDCNQTAPTLGPSIETAEITDDTIINADINSSAAIDFSKLASLTSAQILVGNGSNVPTAVAVSGDATLANTGALSLSTDGRHTRTINATAKTGAYTLTSSDGIILADTSGGAFTLSLPAASGIGGRTYTIKLATAGNTLTIDGDGSETIDGSANTTLSTAGEAVTIASDGTNWRTVSDRSVSSGGVGSTVESSEITDDEIVNADINSGAAIDHSKLASLSSGNILVGNGSNVPTSVPMSGDATMANDGTLTIANNAITTAKIGQTCADGQVLKNSGGGTTWVCANDDSGGGTITRYTSSATDYYAYVAYASGSPIGGGCNSPTYQAVVGSCPATGPDAYNNAAPTGWSCAHNDNTKSLEVYVICLQ